MKLTYRWIKTFLVLLLPLILSSPLWSKIDEPTRSDTRYLVAIEKNAVTITDLIANETIVISSQPGLRGSFVAFFPEKPIKGLPTFAITNSGIQLCTDEGKVRWMTHDEILNTHLERLRR